MKNQCPICGSKSPVLIKKGVWDNSRRSVVKCSHCNVVFLHPMMSGAETERFYKRYDNYLKKREPNKKEYLETEQKEMQSAEYRIRLLRPYLKNTDTLCDIGAANGYFLLKAARYVHKVMAVEPSARAKKSLEIKKIAHADWLDDIDPTAANFNVVSLFHTFEHLPDPVGYLTNLKKYLNKGAKIFVEVPNYDDALLSLYLVAAFRDFYFQSMHCFYYNTETLNDVFKRGGFRAVKNINIQRYGISNHLNWLVFGKAGGNDLFEKIFAGADQDYRASLIKNGKSDTIISIYSLN